MGNVTTLKFKISPGYFELSLMVACLAALHALDVHTTLSAGGLEAEGNVIAAYIWAEAGMGVLIACKLASIVLFIVNWVVQGLFRWGWLLRLVMSAGLVGVLLVNQICNYMILGGVIR